MYWHKHGIPPARFEKVTWLEVVHRSWRGTGHRYNASTEICTFSVLALFRSRLLADTGSQDWGYTMPVPRQPLARYQLTSTGMLLVYNCRGTMPFLKTDMNPTFPPGHRWIFTSGLVMGQYRRNIGSTGDVLAYHRRGSKR